ncbi:hypothetical protein [Hydrogenophaga borbori]|uniref:hypothetical protein n=1 Tax=Hydrogenophaga borbori TaxID=2294117 RepID=UPI0011C1CEFF|nr:hypothetical protein [Hydrogenophaga borbori]
MSTKTKIGETTQAAAPSNPQRPVKIVRTASTPAIFAEGISQLAVGFPMSRVVFHKAVELDANTTPPTEVHQVACELVIPTPALVEAAMTILRHMTNAKGLVNSSRAEWTQRVDTILQQLDQTQGMASDTDTQP